MKRTLLGLVSIFFVGSGCVYAQRSVDRHLVTPSAISAALTTAGLATMPEMVTLPAVITASLPDPELTVASVEPAGGKALRVRMLCKETRQCLPFFATVVLPDHTSVAEAAQQLRGTQALSSEGRSSMQHVRQSAIAVQAGAGATLLIDQGKVHIRFPVVCLQSGAVGQMIEVAASGDRNRTFHVSVLDTGVVRGSL